MTLSIQEYLIQIENNIKNEVEKHIKLIDEKIFNKTDISTPIIYSFSYLDYSSKFQLKLCEKISYEYSKLGWSFFINIAKHPTLYLFINDDERNQFVVENSLE